MDEIAIRQLAKKVVGNVIQKATEEVARQEKIKIQTKRPTTLPLDNLTPSIQIDLVPSRTPSPDEPENDSCKIAKSNSFPWQISLGILPDTPWEIKPDKYAKTSREKVPSEIKMATHVCGGAIINENYILTAAHCVTDENLNTKPFQNYGVGFGNNHDLVDIYNNGRVQVEKIFVNPGYNITLIDTENDIAILKLSQPINIETKSVQPACFMKEKQNIKRIYNEVVASGWGSVTKMQLNYLTRAWTGYEPSQKLKEATFVDVSDNSTVCEDKPKLICIRPIFEQESVCKGDSGGPLHHTAFEPKTIDNQRVPDPTYLEENDQEVLDEINTDTLSAFFSLEKLAKVNKQPLNHLMDNKDIHCHIF
ncbi:hypothetical protein RND71_043568 [Anisodus tanguticus]|uniref:Peptidase S1 domain-containing protein n=1 Tax=Anisodus tanguticus TaxID=243964 RepID=A0AAE1UTP5_9SOLA|nr:hypothetical protein RND71_043568 [Anisodus tanguticus]